MCVGNRSYHGTCDKIPGRVFILDLNDKIRGSVCSGLDRQILGVCSGQE